MKDRVVIITGGAKGIGRYAAHTLAKEGAKLALADTDVQRLHKTVAEMKSPGTDIIAVPTDVHDEKDPPNSPAGTGPTSSGLPPPATLTSCASSVRTMSSTMAQRNSRL
jgi:NAD(P)-dependent dehydrogenase (short-subunit alcohol dehydrogenase family)